MCNKHLVGAHQVLGSVLNIEEIEARNRVSAKSLEYLSKPEGPYITFYLGSSWLSWLSAVGPGTGASEPDQTTYAVECGYERFLG